MTNRRNIRGAEITLAPVRERFGGIDIPASLAGMVTSLGVLFLVVAVAGAVATGLGYRLEPLDFTQQPTDVVVLGAVGVLLVVLAAFLVGGWAAARMARYDGGSNGLAAALWGILMIVLLAAVGAWAGTELDVPGQVRITEWVPGLAGDDLTALGVAAAVAAVGLMLLGGYLGGKAGELYHRKADAVLADSQVVASPPPPSESESPDAVEDDPAERRTVVMADEASDE